MLPTRRPTRLVVEFDGFHQDIPSLSVGAFGMTDERFREHVRRHVHRYMRARFEDIVVEAGMDVREGTVRVSGTAPLDGSVRVNGPGDGEGVAGRLTVSPETEERSGEKRVGVNPLIVVGVVVFLVLVLFF